MSRESSAVPVYLLSVNTLPQAHVGRLLKLASVPFTPVPTTSFAINFVITLYPCCAILETRRFPQCRAATPIAPCRAHSLVPKRLHFLGQGAPHRFVHQLPEHQATHLATRGNEDHTEHGVVLLPLAKEVRPALQQASVTCSPRLPLLQAVDIHGLPTLLTKPHPPWHRAR